MKWSDNKETILKGVGTLTLMYERFFLKSKRVKTTIKYRRVKHFTYQLHNVCLCVCVVCVCLCMCAYVLAGGCSAVVPCRAGEVPHLR